MERRIPNSINFVQKKRLLRYARNDKNGRTLGISMPGTEAGENIESRFTSVLLIFVYTLNDVRKWRNLRVFDGGDVGMARS